MARKPLHYAEKAARAFLRGTGHTSVHSAVTAGARTNEEWRLFLERYHQRFWSTHNKKARRAVKARHPVREVSAGATS